MWRASKKSSGTPLVDRGQSRLTEEGQAVAHRARRVITELSAVKADVAALKNEVIGEVRLGLIGTTARWLVPEVMEIVEGRYPDARIVIREGVTSQLGPQLTSGTLDMAIMILPADAPEITTQVLFEEDMLLVVDGNHPFAGRRNISLAELSDTPLLLPPTGTAARAELDAAALKANGR